MSARLLLVIGAMLGCASPAPRDESVRERVAIRALAGQIFVHQFPAGSHAWAAFTADPVSLAGYRSDQLITLEPRASLAEGACSLHRWPRCTVACPSDSYCSEDEKCAPLPHPQWIDHGPITIDGGSRAPRIRLWFDGAIYASDPAPGSVQLFVPGDTLSFAGNGFATTLPAPALPAMQLEGALHFPTDRAYSIRWQSEASPAIVVNIIASARDGRAAFIRCATADVGALDVPATLMASLPPPPREIRLEVERYDERIIPTSTPGIGVLVRIAQTTWQRGED
jgi:hypothetical protein